MKEYQPTMTIINDDAPMQQIASRASSQATREHGSAPASVRPATSIDADAPHGWGCWVCGIHEDAPTTELARIRVITHVAMVHGELADLARKRNDPSAVVPRYAPAGARPA